VDFWVAGDREQLEIFALEAAGKRNDMGMPSQDNFAPSKQKTQDRCALNLGK
jgi:hypothetical protein